MKFIFDIIKGIFIGIANIIPGVSGGTMAVSMGVYDKLINSINSILKDFKKSFLTLLHITFSTLLHFSPKLPLRFHPDDLPNRLYRNKPLFRKMRRGIWELVSECIPLQSDGETSLPHSESET